LLKEKKAERSSLISFRLEQRLNNERTNERTNRGDRIKGNECPLLSLSQVQWYWEMSLVSASSHKIIEYKKYLSANTVHTPKQGLKPHTDSQHTSSWYNNQTISHSCKRIQKNMSHRVLTARAQMSNGARKNPLSAFLVLFSLLVKD